jgi:hypothetical protein
MRPRRRDRAAIDLDARVGRNFAAHLANDLARNAHAALSHEHLGGTARRHAAVGEHLLQAD